MTDAGLRWGLADGRIGGPRDYQTFILLANPNPHPAEVQVRFLKPAFSGHPDLHAAAVQPPDHLQPTRDVAELGDGVFGVEVQVLNYQPIAVEKAMYWNAGGESFAARHERHRDAPAASVRGPVTAFVCAPALAKDCGSPAHASSSVKRGS